MAQVDIVNYFPLLFWFVFLFLCFYSLIFMYIIPIFYTSLKTREFYLKYLVTRIHIVDYFLEFLLLMYSNFRFGVFSGIAVDLGRRIVFVRIVGKYLFVEALKV